MSELSAAKLAGLREIAEAAHDHIGNLCTGEDRWRMTVPPRDDDSDMLFSALADGVLAMLDRIEELERAISEIPKHCGGSFTASDGYTSVAVADGEAIKEILERVNHDE